MSEPKTHTIEIVLVQYPSTSEPFYTIVETKHLGSYKDWAIVTQPQAIRFEIVSEAEVLVRKVAAIDEKIRAAHVSHGEELIKLQTIRSNLMCLPNPAQVTEFAAVKDDDEPEESN